MDSIDNDLDDIYFIIAQDDHNTNDEEGVCIYWFGRTEEDDDDIQLIQLTNLCDHQGKKAKQEIKSLKTGWGPLAVLHKIVDSTWKIYKQNSPDMIIILTK